MQSAAVALLCVLVLVACGSESKDKPPAAVATPSAAPAPAKSPVLAEYTIKGIQFAYFKIPVGLSQEKLIEAAQALHAQQPKAQLVLVDDDSKLKEYVTYVKAISGQGELNEPMPQEWADKHIVANVQLYLSGKFWLCESNGSKEIAELK